MSTLSQAITKVEDFAHMIGKSEVQQIAGPIVDALKEVERRLVEIEKKIGVPDRR